MFSQQLPLKRLQLVSVCSYSNHQIAEQNMIKVSVFKTCTVQEADSLRRYEKWAISMSIGTVSEVENRVGGAAEDRAMQSLMYLRGRKTPADRMSEAER